MSQFPKCWVFDENRRVYPRDEKGHTTGGPIKIKFWREVEIVSENRRSWITSCHKKVPKAGGSGILFSYEEIEQWAFVEDNRIKIGEAVRQLKDYEKLKAIEAILAAPQPA